MGVADKTALDVGGMSLLDRVLSATAGAGTTVVVGDERPVARRVTWRREHPPGGGPAAALAAALDAITSDRVVLLAGDLPLITSAHIERLVAAITDDGAVYVDDDGAEQWLCSAWRSAVLRQAALGPGRSLRDALTPLTFARVHDSAAAVDVDAPADLHRAEELLT